MNGNLQKARRARFNAWASWAAARGERRWRSPPTGPGGMPRCGPYEPETVSEINSHHTNKRLPSRHRPRSRHQGNHEGERPCRCGSAPARRSGPIPAIGRHGDRAAFQSRNAGRDLCERLRGELGHVHERGREGGAAGSGSRGVVGAEFRRRGSRNLPTALTLACESKSSARS